jgi:hypothetical protein
MTMISATGSRDSAHTKWRQQIRRGRDPRTTHRAEKFGDPLSQCKNDAAFARSSRFKYPLTVSLFFREAVSESTVRRTLTFYKGLESPDAAMKRYDLPRRLAGIADGQLSPAAVESKILIDPAIEVFKAIQAQYSRLDQVPFELDRSGPLHDRVWVLSHGYEMGAQIERKRAHGQVANVQRNIWILKRRDKGSSEPLV